ncbi:IS5/IS1182 family transposase [Rheinheimera baltica]|nr:IS5/IS1182 family transposase [Rheinheimera baltica]
MLKDSPQTSPQIGFFDLISQLDQKHPLLLLADEIDWNFLNKTLSVHYSDKGRPGKPVRLMCGLLMLKQMYNLSDDNVIAQWMMNPYYQVFCGEVDFQTEPPCHRTDITAFRLRIGEEGVNAIFAVSVALHQQDAEEDKVLVDTTVQEKAITYPTDTKLAIKIINRLNKLAKKHGIKQRRTYVTEVKQLRLQCRHFRHPKLRGKARRALKRLRTIAGAVTIVKQRK